MASFLAVFSAHKALDDHGTDIPVIPKFTTGFTVFVKFHLSLRLVRLSFVASVIPRNFLTALSSDTRVHLRH